MLFEKVGWGHKTGFFVCVCEKDNDLDKNHSTDSVIHLNLFNLITYSIKLLNKKNYKIFLGGKFCAKKNIC